RMAFEHPLARQDLGPGIGHTCPANLPEKQNAHAHMFPTREADRLQWKPDLYRISVIHNLCRTIPDEICLELLAGRRRVQCIHLDAAGMDEQVISGLAGTRRIETQSKPIVIECRITAADRGADLSRLGIEAVESEIDIPIIVSNSDIGPLICFGAT